MQKLLYKPSACENFSSGRFAELLFHTACGSGAILARHDETKRGRMYKMHRHPTIRNGGGSAQSDGLAIRAFCDTYGARITHSSNRNVMITMNSDDFQKLVTVLSNATYHPDVPTSSDLDHVYALLRASRASP